MKKLKIYLDTCVVGYLDQADDPERMRDTQILWDEIQAGLYDVVISDLALAEIDRCHESRRAVLANHLALIDFEQVIVTPPIKTLAQVFIDQNILTMKSEDDCRHIACAMYYGCDVIVSWNFKHFVNHRTIHGVKIVSAITGYNSVSIYSPTMLIGGDQDD